MLPDIEKLIKFLQDVQIFTGLDDAALGLIAVRLKEAEYPQGTVIFSEGDEPDHMYLVASGKVRVTHLDEATGEPSELAIFDVGDVFGIDALYFKRERSATVTALSDVHLYYLNSDDFEWLKNTYPQIEPYLDAFLRTYEIARSLRIDWLGDGEFITLITRRHPIRLFGEILVLLLLASIDITLLVALGFLQDILPWLFHSLGVIGGIFGLLVLGASVWAWFEWRNDYFVVTNVRVVWRERILFRATSRQETPLRTIQSLNIQTGNFIERAIHVGDLVVRTFNSELRMTDVYYPERMKDLIQGFILRSRRRSRREELAEIRRTIRQRLKIQKDAIPSEEPAKVPPVESVRLSRFSIFRTRIVEGSSITYRKHWWIFLKNALLPNLLFISALIVVFVVVPILFVVGFQGSGIVLLIALFLGIGCFLWWGYEYLDWSNDLYRVTGDLIIDRDKKPFGKESFRSAPIKNIQSLGHEIPNLIGLILNVGNVKINVGDETFTFHGVHDPAVVHQDISRRMEELIARQEREQVSKEHERMATWLEIYHDETKDQRMPPLPPLPPLEPDF